VELCAGGEGDAVMRHESEIRFADRDANVVAVFDQDHMPVAVAGFVSEAECRRREAAAWAKGWSASWMYLSPDDNPFMAPQTPPPLPQTPNPRPGL
jgi:hypothetical protein